MQNPGRLAVSEYRLFPFRSQATASDFQRFISYHPVWSARHGVCCRGEYIACQRQSSCPLSTRTVTFRKSLTTLKLFDTDIMLFARPASINAVKAGCSISYLAASSLISRSSLQSVRAYASAGASVCTCTPCSANGLSDVSSVSHSKRDRNP